jgi:hypothetical protein
MEMVNGTEADEMKRIQFKVIFCCTKLRPVSYNRSIENDTLTDADFHVRRQRADQ